MLWESLAATDDQLLSLDDRKTFFIISLSAGHPGFHRLFIIFLRPQPWVGYLLPSGSFMGHFICTALSTVQYLY